MDFAIKQPSKELVREYLAGRVAEHTPPPSDDEIRRRLGWKLVEAERRTSNRVSSMSNDVKLDRP